MLEIRDLHVILGRRAVLAGLSLTARPGEVLAICGPNGAGKSTLLRAAVGEIPSRGLLALNGFDVRTTPPARMARLRAVMAQDTQVAFAFTVAEVVGLGQEAGDFAGDPGLVSRALAAVGLAGHGGRAFHTLSGGERQRTHLARALAQIGLEIGSPAGPAGQRWLFLDEPVASLDLGHQLSVMRLARAHADAGGGVVAVMHDLNLSAMFADRMVFLIDGRLAADGPPAEVMQDALLSSAYGCQVQLNRLPEAGPWLLPQSCLTPEP